MRFVHSFWTPPKFSGDIHIDRVLECDILYYAYSFACLKRLEQKVVLYTDDMGAEILSFIPYDEVHLTLNDIPENANHNMWACGKFFAMKNEPLNSIHIDGDVFIETKDCLDEIIKQYEANDIIVQDIEKNVSYRNYSYLTEAGVKTPNYSISLITDSCCTGIIGFNNQQLKDKYIEQYFSLFEQIRGNDRLKNIDKNFIIDLVCEQYFLKCLCDTFNYNVGTLIKNYLTRYDESKKLGFVHLMGVEKYGTQAKLDKYRNKLCILSLNLFLEYIKKYPEYFNKSEA